MMNDQLELGIGSNGATPIIKGRRGSSARARWWFSQMRRVVNGALDWPSAPEPPAQQIWLEEATRIFTNRAKSNSNERQICA